MTIVLGRARPSWAGAVRISDNDPASSVLNLKSPRKVEGIVVPLTTAGRPNTPKPISGATTGAAVSLDKGHMMALDLGGPDVPANIIPQENLCQQSGGWRQLEKAVGDQSMEWMGWANKDDPNVVQNAAMPRSAAYFVVAPETLKNGQTPDTYVGSVTKVSLSSTGGSNYGWALSLPHQTRAFYIKPEGFTWK